MDTKGQMSNKRRPGRPPRSTAPSLERIELRVTKAEKRAWERDAAACGRTLSDWIRDCVNAVTG